MASAADPGALLDHPLVAARYFFPRRAFIPEPRWVDAGDARLACALRRTDAPDPLTVVHFHGNGEVVADWLEDGLADAITGRLGCDLLLAEYRGYGLSTGAPRLGRMLDDVEAIVRAAGVPPERIVLFGRSVGSIFAIEAAARFPSAAGLVLESGIADVLERLLLRVEPEEVGATAAAFEAAVAARLDHRAKLAAYPGPVLVMHALHDDLVPAAHARRLAEWAAGPVILKLFEHGDHNSLLAANACAYLAAVAELVALAGGSPRIAP